MGNRCSLPSPPSRGRDLRGARAGRGPRSEVQAAEAAVGREGPEPLERGQAPVPPVRPPGVVELVEPPVRLLQLREGATPRGPVELLGVDPVAPLDLPVQVGTARPDAAVGDPRRLAGEREGVQAYRLVRGRLRGAHGPSW